MRSFRKERINCVLAEYGPTGVEIMEVAKEMRMPLIVHFHGFDATNSNTLHQYASKYPELFSYATYIIVVSQKMRKDLITLGCPASKIVTTPCGPNPEFLTLKPGFQSQQVIAVARFVDVKGYLFSISAFKKVLDVNPHVKMVCIGDGPQLESCRQFVKIIGIKDAIIFKGIMSPDEIKKEMEQSFVFIQHSVTLTDGLTEGSPVSLMEAMATGLPVVCSKSGGIIDLVVDGQTGFLVSECDIDAMAESMKRLLADKELAKKMGHSAKERIEKKLSLKIHIETIADLVNKSVSKNGLNK